MCTIKLYDVMTGKDFPDAGNSLYDLIKDNLSSCNKVVIDLEGISSLPSMFLNVSIGRFIDEFGLDDLRNKISFTKITRSQAERITEYIEKSNKKQK